MIHDVHAVEQRLDRHIAQIRQGDLATRARREAIEVGLFLADVVVVRQAIDDANGVTSVEESLDEMRSDEAGSAGDERAHE